MRDNILHHLDDILKLAEETLTYERVFDLTGLSDLLDSMYVKPTDLSKSYVDIFFKEIKSFVKQPLYRGLDLNTEKDLKFLRSNRDFISVIKNKIAKIKDKLVPRHFRVLDYILEFEPKSKISVEDIKKETKFDLTTLMFILDDLKKTNKIYDYNGREVVLK